MITHVEVTPSSGSDSVVTTRVIDELSERGIGPSELWADTSYGSGRNGWEAERKGTELVSPVGGRSPPRTRKRPRPWSRFISEFVPSIPARSPYRLRHW